MPLRERCWASYLATTKGKPSLQRLPRNKHIFLPGTFHHDCHQLVAWHRKYRHNFTCPLHCCQATCRSSLTYSLYSVLRSLYLKPVKDSTAVHSIVSQLREPKQVISQHLTAFLREKHYNEVMSSKNKKR